MIQESGCPEPSILAAFAEQTLDAGTSRIVQSHVADCSECTVVVSDTVRFLQPAEVRDEHVRRRWRPGRATAATVAAFGIAGVLWHAASSRDVLNDLRKAAAQSSERPVEGWLYRFDHGRLTRPRSPEEPPVSIAVAAEAEALLVRRHEDAETLHAQGVAYLLLGNARQAAFLIRKGALATNEAAYWNDLAAAEIALFGIDRDRNALRRSLDASDHAIRLSPELAPAHFNRGVALEKLSLYSAAVEEYRNAVSGDVSAEWETEIRGRISHLLAIR